MSINPTVALREALGLDNADNMIATGEDLDWLIQQLIQWPIRVHQERTTNDRFLRQSAALTLAALTPTQDSGGSGEALAALVEPFADYHGDLPDYDHPLRCVFESGVQYTVELLAKELKVDDWTPCDGTEEYDGDLGGTLMNIVMGSLPTDEHGDHYRPSEMAALITPQGGSGELLREAGVLDGRNY